MFVGETLEKQVHPYYYANVYSLVLLLAEIRT